MLSAEHSVVINRDIETVFDFLADGTNDPRWRSGVLEISRVSAEDGVGAAYRQVMAGPGGRRIDGDYRVTTFDRPHRFGFEVIAGPARPVGMFDLTEQEPGRTQVRFRLELQPQGAMRFMGPMINRQLRKEVAALDSLKGVLESGIPST